MTHVPKHVPARTNDGWGIAVLVFALAAVCIAGVTVIHKRTYKHPTDPTNHTVNGRAGHTPAPAASH
jgi:hypothetical protein